MAKLRSFTKFTEIPIILTLVMTLLTNQLVMYKMLKAFVAG